MTMTHNKPSPIVVTILIHGYGLNGDIEGAKAMYHKMRDLGIVPIVDTYNTLMSAYVLNHREEEALQWYTEILKAGLTPDQTTFNILLSCFQRQGNDAAAMEIYKTLLDVGLMPTSHTVTAMTHLYINKKKVNDARQFQDLFFERYPNVPVTIQPHNVLMKSMSVEGDLKAMVEEFHRATQKMNAEPTLVTFDLLIRAHASVDLKASRRWFDLGVAMCKHTLDASIYAALMTAYKNANQPELVRGVFREMQAAGIKANLDVYSIMTEIGGEEGSSGQERVKETVESRKSSDPIRLEKPKMEHKKVSAVQ